MSTSHSFCTNCGSSLETGDQFCTSCGQRFDEAGAPSPAPQPPPAPQSLTVGGHYRLEGELGHGAAGTVYLATDESLGQEVALKSLDPALASLSEFRDRFRREAATLAGLSHPNVVAVRDYLEDDDRPYLVMERVKGPSLRQLLTSYGHLAPEQACGVLCGALSGLGFAHDNGLLHGDVKPENVLVDPAGVSKLSDFGQAVPLGSVASGGSVPYMSPEALSAAPLDARSDLYSIGAVLFECLAGRTPFVADQVPTLVHQALHDPAPAISGLPEPMAALVARSLAKDPDGRPQSAREFLDELTEAARRSYGADWAARAGVAALAGAVAVGIAVATGAGPAGAAVATTSGAPGSGGVGTSALAAHTTARHSARWLPKFLATNKAASIGVTAVLVTGAVVGGVAATRSPSRIQLGPSYEMTYHNTTFDVSSVGELSDVTEKSNGNIAGELTVDPPLSGSGPFVGKVRGTDVSFAVNGSSFLLTGRIDPQGNLSGTYVISGQKGTWIARSQSATTSRSATGVTGATGSRPPSVASPPRSTGRIGAATTITTISSTAVTPSTSFSPVVGEWTDHDGGMTINDSGDGNWMFGDCGNISNCTHANMLGDTVTFHLTSIQNGVATGSITSITGPNTESLSVGMAVQISTAAGSPGQLLSMTVNGETRATYCDSTAELSGECGA